MVRHARVPSSRESRQANCGVGHQPRERALPASEWSDGYRESHAGDGDASSSDVGAAVKRSLLALGIAMAILGACNKDNTVPYIQSTVTPTASPTWQSLVKPGARPLYAVPTP